MVLDASLLNTQHHKVRIKGKVEQSREGVAPSPTHWCSSYRKGSLQVTLDYGRQLYLLYSFIIIHIILSKFCLFLFICLFIFNLYFLARHNFTALIAFAEVVKVNFTRLIVSDRYSPDLLQNQSFTSSSRFLLPAAKFLQPSGYSLVINCAFTFPATKVFCFHPRRYGPIRTPRV